MSSPFDSERRPADDEWSAAHRDSGYPNPPQPSDTPYHRSLGYPLPLPAAVASWTPTAPSPGPASAARRRRLVGAAAALVIAVAGGAVGAAAIGLSDHGRSDSASTASSGTPVQTVVNSSNTSVVNLVKAVDPVVVSLTVTGGNQADEGSGIVLKSNGLILTNNHVISAAEGGGTVTVTFSNGESAKATIVAADASKDLAIVQAAGVSGRPTATLADSSTVRVGDSVIAIGNELGLSNSVSSGIVSALHRKVSVASDQNTPMNGSGRNFGGSGSAGTTYANAIQTDAAINQGDSGGALFNMQGQVIGIDSAIATASDGSSGSVGIGFAIASNDAQTFIKANS